MQCEVSAFVFLLLTSLKLVQQGRNLQALVLTSARVRDIAHRFSSVPWFEVPASLFAKSGIFKRLYTF